MKQTCKVKQLHGKSFNGQMLLGLAMDFCDAVNSEDTPKIESSVTRLVQEETQVIQDEAYTQLQAAIESELGLEPASEPQLREVLTRAKQNSVRTLQYNLARFLSYDEIMLETQRFKQRVHQTGLLKSKEYFNYTNGFYYSQQLLERLLGEREDSLVLPPTELQGAEICQEPESVAQIDAINNLFKEWQTLVKVYRAGGQEEEDEERSDADEERE